MPPTGSSLGTTTFVIITVVSVVARMLAIKMEINLNKNFELQRNNKNAFRKITEDKHKK